MTRVHLRLGAALIPLLVVAGCLINAPQSEPPYYSYLKILPNYDLQDAPEGTCYQLWAFDLDETITNIEFHPMVRFLWDAENFRTLDLQGNSIPLYDPVGPGMDMGINVLGHILVGITIEPLNDPNPNLPDGPVIVFYVDLSALGVPGFPSVLAENKEVDLRLDSDFGGISPGPGSPSISFLSQSTQWRRQMVQGENVCWRDATSGTGLWFVEPTVVNRVVEDTVAFGLNPDTTEGPGTLYTRAIDLNADGRQYLMWINPVHPESSWSNFDNVFPNRIPDLRFLDRNPIRPPGILPPPSSGINRLGGNPIISGLDTIGFMYFPDTANAPNFRDTCFLRVDDPSLTYCTHHPDTAKFYPISDTNYIVREFTTTWADTFIRPTLTSLPVLPTDQTGMVYETWLIFDSVNNPVYPPLSLGRIDGSPTLDGLPRGAFERDSGDPYTDNANRDPHFNFPGEDLLSGLPEPFPSPLNLFNFPGVQRIKLWITLEPVNDWDFDRPFTQLIAYATQLRPDTPAALDSARVQCGRRGVAGFVSPYPVFSLPLAYRPRGLHRSDLVEGNNWPVVKIMITDANEAAKMQ